MAEKSVVDGDDLSCSTEDMMVVASNVVVKEHGQHDVSAKMEFQSRVNDSVVS